MKKKPTSASGPRVTKPPPIEITDEVQAQRDRDLKDRRAAGAFGQTPRKDAPLNATGMPNIG